MRGAIYEVSAKLIVRALKTIGALPIEATCEIGRPNEATQSGCDLVIKATCDQSIFLPEVADGAEFPHRIAVVGNRYGETPKFGSWS